LINLTFVHRVRGIIALIVRVSDRLSDTVVRISNGFPSEAAQFVASVAELDLVAVGLRFPPSDLWSLVLFFVFLCQRAKVTRPSYGLSSAVRQGIGRHLRKLANQQPAGSLPMPPPAEQQKYAGSKPALSMCQAKLPPATPCRDISQSSSEEDSRAVQACLDAGPRRFPKNRCHTILYWNPRTDPFTVPWPCV
jgi:hypothetical protein